MSVLGSLFISKGVCNYSLLLYYYCFSLFCSSNCCMFTHEYAIDNSQGKKNVTPLLSRNSTTLFWLLRACFIHEHWAVLFNTISLLERGNLDNRRSSYFANWIQTSLPLSLSVKKFVDRVLIFCARKVVLQIY